MKEDLDNSRWLTGTMFLFGNVKTPPPRPDAKHIDNCATPHYYDLFYKAHVAKNHRTQQAFC
jgi:hypothetical protein